MNPTDEKEPPLPDEAEALLENWPIPERDLGDWESLAAQIDARIERTPIGSTEDALLMAPLPQNAEDDRQSERRSHPRVKRPSDGGLAALAKATMLVRDEEYGTELAQATLDVARRARDAARPRTARTAVVAQNPEPVEAQDSGRTSRVTWISMTFGLVGIAAAVVMYVSTRQPEPVAMMAPALPLGAAAPPFEQTPKGAQSKTEDEGVPALPVEEVPLAQPERTVAAAASPRAAAAKPMPPAQQEAPTRASKAEPPAPAPGPSEAGMVMADGRAGIADRPSPGAVQAAVGSVMGAARACTAGLSGVSRAALTFGSNGQVLSVGVSGPAQGTGAEACIQTALGRARVQPFARPSYTVKLSVRPE
jgi:DNA segregation ATPase FtsK/SpoIIIE-like protein